MGHRLRKRYGRSHYAGSKLRVVTRKLHVYNGSNTVTLEPGDLVEVGDYSQVGFANYLHAKRWRKPHGEWHAFTGFATVTLGGTRPA